MDLIKLSWRTETDLSARPAPALRPLGIRVHSVPGPIPLASTHLGFICPELWFVYFFSGPESKIPRIYPIKSLQCMLHRLPIFPLATE